MSSKTKIVVLRMKEIIYTAIFLILGILLISLFLFMFRPGKEDAPASSLSPSSNFPRRMRKGWRKFLTEIWSSSSPSPASPRSSSPLSSSAVLAAFSQKGVSAARSR